MRLALDSVSEFRRPRQRRPSRTALAKHYYRVGTLRSCEELLSSCGSSSRRFRGLRNSDYLRALNGFRGHCLLRRGTMRLVWSAQSGCTPPQWPRVMTDTRDSRVANVALCQLRIGCYDEAIYWTKRLGANPSVCLADQVSTLGGMALASGMTGNRPRAGAIAAEAMRLASVEDEPWVIRRRANPRGGRRTILLAGDTREGNSDREARHQCWFTVAG